MKKYLAYFLLTVLPAALLVISNEIQGQMVESYNQGDASGLTAFLSFFLPLFTIILLVFLLLYSLRFVSRADYRFLLGALAAGYLFFALYTNFIGSKFLPMDALAGQFLVEDLPKYAGYYGGAFLFAASRKNRK